MIATTTTKTHEKPHTASETLKLFHMQSGTRKDTQNYHFYSILENAVKH